MKKSKRIYTVLIAVLAVILTACFAGCTTRQIEVNKVEDIDATLGEKAYEYLQTLASEDLKDRTLGTQGELNGAKYIVGLMTDFGYEGAYTSESGKGIQEFKTTFKRFDGKEVSDAPAYNVIFSKKSKSKNSKGEIIFTCSYDNMFSEKADVSGNLWNADGSYESGSSIAVMLTLAQVLKDKDCDYDLTFAFLTGGCYGWKGAMNFADNLDRKRLDSIALVINFAMLGGGDNLYVYSGESKTSYGEFLHGCGGDIFTAVPKDRNIGQFVLSEDAIFNYANIGMLSNQYFFDVKRVPSANFLSLNWEINDNPLFSEMKGKDNVYHTKKDTLQTMIERKGEEKIKEQLFGVISAVLTALDESNQENLSATLKVARDELPSAGAQSGKSATLANIIVKIVLIAVLIALSYVIKTALTKNIDKYTKAKKANETVDKSADDIKEPFEFSKDDTVSVDAQDQQNTQKESENIDKIDPFA